MMRSTRVQESPRHTPGPMRTMAQSSFLTVGRVAARPRIATLAFFATFFLTLFLFRSASPAWSGLDLTLTGVPSFLRWGVDWSAAAARSTSSLCVGGRLTDLPDWRRAMVAVRGSEAMSVTDGPSDQNHLRVIKCVVVAVSESFLFRR